MEEHGAKTAAAAVRVIEAHRVSHLKRNSTWRVKGPPLFIDRVDRQKGTNDKESLRD